MGTTTDGVYFGGKSERKAQARQSLEAQLKRGDKPRKNGKQFSDYAPEELVWSVPEKKDEKPKPLAVKLTEKDIARIKRELEVLIP